MSKANPPNGSLFPAAQIKRLEREYAALGKQVEKIEDRRSVILTIIEAAKSLGPTAENPTAAVGGRKRKRATAKRARGRPRSPAAQAPKSPAPVTQTSSDQPRHRAHRETSEWKMIVREIALTSDRPVSYREARQEIMKTPLGEHLQKSDKGFFYAISKLSKAGEIVAYKGHLFAPQVFAKFKADLDAGLIRDLRFENAAHHSPMGEATMAMMRTRKHGAESGHMIWELKKNPEFAAIIEKNKTHPYNVFARLVRTGQLVKRGKRYFAVEVLKNETPSDSTSEGVSKSVGEGDASPVESQGPEGLFG